MATEIILSIPKNIMTVNEEEDVGGIYVSPGTVGVSIVMISTFGCQRGKGWFQSLPRHKFPLGLHLE